MNNYLERKYLASLRYDELSKLNTNCTRNSIMQYFWHRDMDIMNDEHFEKYKELFRLGKLRAGNPSFVRKQNETV